MPLVLGGRREHVRSLRAGDPLDHRERHVDPGRDPRRGPELPILDPARLPDPAHRGPGALGPGEEHLVRRGAAAVEEPGLGEQRRAGADRHRDLELLGPGPQPLDERAVVDLRPGADAAGDEQQVERRTVVEPVVRLDARALRAAHEAGPVGKGVDHDRPLHVAEHLERPEQVEQLEVVVEQRSEGARHRPSSCPTLASPTGRPQGQRPHPSGHQRPCGPATHARMGIDTPPFRASQIAQERESPPWEAEVVRIYLVTPRNPPSFWTYDHVLATLGKRCLFPNLSMPTVAGLTPREHEVVLCDENVEEVDLDFDADIVGITGYVIHKERMIELIDAFRARGRFVVVGGPYASLCPEELRGRGDVLFVDEAGEHWPEFLRDYPAGTGKAEYCPAEKPDLTTSPMPRFDLLPVDRYQALTIQFARGCPFSCEFCDIIVVYGRRPRAKAVGQVMAEIAECHRLGAKQIFLVDD